MINHPNRAKNETKITAAVASKVLEVVDAGLAHGLGKPNPGEMCVEAAVCYALGLPHGDNPACVAPALRALKIRLNDSGWSSNQARASGMRRLAVAQLGSAGKLDEQEFRRRVVDIALRKTTPAALRAAASIQKDHKHKAALLDAAARCEKEGTREAALAGKEVARNADAYAADAAADAADAADAAADAADAAAYAAAYADAAADAYAADAADAATASAAAADAAAAAAADAAAAAYAYAADAATAAAAAADDAAAAADAAAADAAAYAAAYKKRSDARDKSLAAYAEEIVQVLFDMKAPGCQWLELTEIAA